MTLEQKTDLQESISKNEVQDLRTLIEKSLKLSEEVYDQNKKINKKLRNMVLGSYLRLALVIIPIIIGIIYLPPYFSQIFKQYQELLNVDNILTVEQFTGSSSANQIKEIIELLKK